jgi:hypothetical protein
MIFPYGTVLVKGMLAADNLTLITTQSLCSDQAKQCHKPLCAISSKMSFSVQLEGLEFLNLSYMRQTRTDTCSNLKCVKVEELLGLM